MINDELIRALFAEDLNIIFAAAYGSYSRGEEAYIKGHDGISRLFNDFDLVVVVKDMNLFSQRIAYYQENLVRIVGGAEVDLLVLDKPLSFRRKSTIWYNDFRFTKKFFLGGLDEMELYFGELKPHNISVFDVYALFVTRSWAAGCLSANLIEEPYTLFFKRYQAAKLVIATVDLYLLAHSKYKTMLDDKLVALQSIDDDFATYLIPKFVTAVQVKLSPTMDLRSEASADFGGAEEYLSDYNHAFSTYLSSKIFASDTMLKIFMAVRYLKTLAFGKDKVVAKKLRSRHKIAALVRAHGKDKTSINYNKQLVENFINS